QDIQRRGPADTLLVVDRSPASASEGMLKRRPRNAVEAQVEHEQTVGGEQLEHRAEMGLRIFGTRAEVAFYLDSQCRREQRRGAHEHMLLISFDVHLEEIRSPDHALLEERVEPADANAAHLPLGSTVNAMAIRTGLIEGA